MKIEAAKRLMQTAAQLKASEGMPAIAEWLESVMKVKGIAETVSKDNKYLTFEIRVSGGREGFLTITVGIDGKVLIIKGLVSKFNIDWKAKGTNVKKVLKDFKSQLEDDIENLEEEDDSSMTKLIKVMQKLVSAKSKVE